MAPWHQQRVRITGTLCQLNRRGRSCVLVDQSHHTPHLTIHVDLSLISVDIPLEMGHQCQFLGELRQTDDVMTETLVIGRDQQEGHAQGEGEEVDMVGGEEMVGEGIGENDVIEVNHHTSSSSSSSSSSNGNSNGNINGYNSSNNNHDPDSIFDHHHHLPALSPLRGVYLYATDCRMVPDLDIVLLKQTTMARRTFLTTLQQHK